VLYIRVAECKGRLDLVGLARGARDVRNVADVDILAVLPLEDPGICAGLEVFKVLQQLDRGSDQTKICLRIFTAWRIGTMQHALFISMTYCATLVEVEGILKSNKKMEWRKRGDHTQTEGKTNATLPQFFPNKKKVTTT